MMILSEQQGKKTLSEAEQTYNLILYGCFNLEEQFVKRTNIHGKLEEKIILSEVMNQPFNPRNGKIAKLMADDLYMRAKDLPSMFNCDGYEPNHVLVNVKETIGKIEEGMKKLLRDAKYGKFKDSVERRITCVNSIFRGPNSNPDSLDAFTCSFDKEVIQTRVKRGNFDGLENIDWDEWDQLLKEDENLEDLSDCDLGNTDDDSSGSEVGLRVTNKRKRKISSDESGIEPAIEFR